MHCKVEMDSLHLSQHAGLITGKITANLRLKDLDACLNFKSFTSVGVALSCCSTLGLEGAVSLSKGVETAEKIGIFFFFFHKPVSNLECSKPVSSDYNSAHFMKLPQVPLALLKAELMEELNCLLYLRRLMLAGKN